MTNQDQNPKTPDFKHRNEDYPHNNIIYATLQIQTVLDLLYSSLEPAEIPPPAFRTADRLHEQHERLKERVNDALHIIDSLNRDVKAIALAI